MADSDFVSRSLLVSDLITGQFARNTWYVDGASKVAIRTGKSFDTAFATVTAALNAASAGDRILVSANAGTDYNESVSIGVGMDNITIIGVGPRGSVTIAPSTANATALTCKGRDCTFVNIGFNGNGTGAAAVITGRRNSFYQVKFEDSDGSNALIIGPGTAAAIAAGTDDKGDFGYFYDCEFANALVAVLLKASDQGASGQHKFVGSSFYNCPTAHVSESTGSGGAAGITFRDCRFVECIFRPAEDGTEPTKYFSLNGANTNTGLVTKCVFITAINGGKNLVSTAMKWVGNFHPAGISAAQPS